MALLLNETPTTIAIERPVDVERARRGARSLARSHGFSAEDSEALVLAVSELATNLLRHAVNGSIVMSSTAAGAVQIESHDSGPGIPDVDVALRDNFSTAGGLGRGLAAVRRLTDEIEITSSPSGTHIVARKWPNRRS